MGDDDYEHWPEAGKQQCTTPAAPAAGFDSHNGLHTHSYLAAAKDPSPTPAPDMTVYETASYPCAPQPVYYPHPAATYAAPQQYYAVPQPIAQQQTYAAPQPMPQQQNYVVAQPMPQQQVYGGYPQQVYGGNPQPGYYGYPQPNMAPAGPVIAVAPPAAKSVTPPPTPAEPIPEPAPAKNNTHFYVPRFTGGEEAVVIPQPSAWLGRTKAQVEEDNSKIAKEQGAWDARKMVPKDVPDDQVLWVIELDNTKTLRTFKDIKDMKGEWKRDPRYPDAWYFIREEEEKK
ncbi:unnamed protein product [Zymoseptoria tritici ST99CH_3D1]|nr:unnamed protein product [Zymoseptoria tritici ST99CH_3D1]